MAYESNQLNGNPLAGTLLSMHAAFPLFLEVPAKIHDLLKGVPQSIAAAYKEAKHNGVARSYLSALRSSVVTAGVSCSEEPAEIARGIATVLEPLVRDPLTLDGSRLNVIARFIGHLEAAYVRLRSNRLTFHADGPVGELRGDHIWLLPGDESLERMVQVFTRQTTPAQHFLYDSTIYSRATGKMLGSYYLVQTGDVPYLHSIGCEMARKEGQVFLTLPWMKDSLVVPDTGLKVQDECSETTSPYLICGKMLVHLDAQFCFEKPGDVDRVLATPEGFVFFRSAFRGKQFAVSLCDGSREVEVRIDGEPLRVPYPNARFDDGQLQLEVMAGDGHGEMVVAVARNGSAKRLDTPRGLSVEVPEIITDRTDRRYSLSVHGASSTLVDLETRSETRFHAAWIYQLPDGHGFISVKKKAAGTQRVFKRDFEEAPFATINVTSPDHDIHRVSCTEDGVPVVVTWHYGQMAFHLLAPQVLSHTLSVSGQIQAVAGMPGAFFVPVEEAEDTGYRLIHFVKRYDGAYELPSPNMLFAKEAKLIQGHGTSIIRTPPNGWYDPALKQAFRVDAPKGSEPWVMITADKEIYAFYWTTSGPRLFSIRSEQEINLPNIPFTEDQRCSHAEVSDDGMLTLILEQKPSWHPTSKVFELIEVPFRDRRV